MNTHRSDCHSIWFPFFSLFIEMKTWRSEEAKFIIRSDDERKARLIHSFQCNSILGGQRSTNADWRFDYLQRSERKDDHWSNLLEWRESNHRSVDENYSIQVHDRMRRSSDRTDWSLTDESPNAERMKIEKTAIERIIRHSSDILKVHRRNDHLHRLINTRSEWSLFSFFVQ